MTFIIKLAGNLTSKKVLAKQKYTSACTSVNNKKVTALSRVIAAKYSGTGWDVLDYGGGKYDTVTEFLEEQQIHNHIYDPYNRSAEENDEALSKKDYLIVMLSNVLNVIAEKETRIEILRNIKNHMSLCGSLFIKVYEGDKTGILKINEKKNSCQLNRKTIDYIEEIQEVFEVVNYEWSCGIPIIVAEKKGGE